MSKGGSGYFGGTKGAKTLYSEKTKSGALSSVSSMPSSIQKSVKSFFKGSSNNYNHYSVQKTEKGGYLVKMENPGRVPGSKAIYYKEINSEGKTVRVYKETYDPSGKLVHTKEK